MDLPSTSTSTSTSTSSDLSRKRRSLFGTEECPTPTAPVTQEYGMKHRQAMYESQMTRVVKGLKSKNAKLDEENQKLKKELQQVSALCAAQAQNQSQLLRVTDVYNTVLSACQGCTSTLRAWHQHLHPQASFQPSSTSSNVQKVDIVQQAIAETGIDIEDETGEGTSANAQVRTGFLPTTSDDIWSSMPPLVPLNNDEARTERDNVL